MLPSFNPVPQETIVQTSYKKYPVFIPPPRPGASTNCMVNPSATHELKSNFYSTPGGYGSKTILVECKENIDRMRMEWKAKQRMTAYKSA